MDQERFRLLRERIQDFLNSKRSRENLVFLFFLIVSGGFWLMQTLNESYETEYRLPLQLNNVPQGIVITTDLPQYLSADITDRGNTLITYFLRRKKKPIVIDFQEYDKGESFGHVVVSHSEIQKQIADFLEPSTRIISIRPDTLEYYFTRGVHKRVPVEIRGVVEANPLYFLSEVRCVPDSVDVWAEQRYLDSLTMMPTVSVNWKDLKETTEEKVALQRRRGMKVEPSSISLTAVVDIYVENQVQVPVIGTNFPAGYSLRTFPPVATLSFRIGSQRFKEVTSEDFVLSATYEELLQLPDSILHLQLRSVPEGVSQVKITPPDVQFMIEMTDAEE